MTSQDAATLPSLPSAIGGWSIVWIAAGLWVSESNRPVPPAVLRLPAEAGRLSVVVDARAPSAETDSLLAELFPLLRSAGTITVRLVLSSGADRYARDAARVHGLDIIAAEAEVTITPYGYALVRSDGPTVQGALPQWRRYLPSSDSLPAGLLYPSPAWERGLSDELNTGPGQLLVARRVPAGVAVHLPGQAMGFAAARAVWPDPERLIVVVVGDAGGERALLDGLTALVGELSRASVAGVRLWWPRAVARAGAEALQEAADRCGTDLIAPMADLSASEECGGVCHGPAGAAPWVRFAPGSDRRLMGSLYPEPDWERSLARASLVPPAGLVIEHVAAGLGLYSQDSSASGLAEVARRLVPDPARATIVVGGDAENMAVRQKLETVIGQLPPGARCSLRITLTAAGRGGPLSYAQYLADTFDCPIVAPTGEWTATPDGYLLAGPAADGEDRPQAEASGWREFSRRSALSRHRSPDPGPDDRPPVPEGDGAAEAVLAAQGQRLVRIASDADVFYAAAAVALQRVFGWVVPDPQVLRDWLALGLRTDKGYRDALPARVARLLAERNVDWEQVAGQIETRGSGQNLAGEVAPELLAVMSGVEIVCVFGDGTQNAIAPPSRVALADPFTGEPVRIFLVRSGDKHWDAAEPASAPAWSQVSDQAGEQEWGYALARAMTGNPLVVGAMRMAVTRLLTYLSCHFGAADAAQAFFLPGRLADPAAHTATADLLAVDTPLRSLVMAFRSACWGDSPYSFSRLWSDWPMQQVLRALGMDASWVLLVRWALLADELGRDDGLSPAGRRVWLWRKWVAQASAGRGVIAGSRC